MLRGERFEIGIHNREAVFVDDDFRAPGSGVDQSVVGAIFDAASKPVSNVGRHHFHGFAVRTAVQLDVLKATFAW
jgi:hypothetical protein